VDLGLRDRVAVVTGASRGIGRRVAEGLAAEGCDLVLCARDEGRLGDVGASVEALGRRAVVVAVDLTAPDAPGEIVGRCRSTLGRLDILVNNAGGSAPKRLDRLTDDDWRDGFDVNFLAAARLAVAAVPLMRERGWGRIVNVASTYGVEPDPLFAPYAAAKAALVNLSKSLARAFSAEGILTNCVIPGVTMTELVEANAESAAAAMGGTADEVMAKVMGKDPVAAGRFGRPEEVAAAIVFLASEQAGWITGAALAVDGGTLRSV
jgi:3-oxoacyl-[acyl-carrier protein] reductase